MLYAPSGLKVDNIEAAGLKKSIAERGKGPNQEFTALRSPDDLLVVAAGGPAGGFGAVIPPWLGTWSHAVTAAIKD